MQDVDEAQARTRAVAQLFNRVAEGYDHDALRFFPFVADRLIARLGPRPGEKILDVATGTGAVAVSAAQAVGPEGRVLAIDLAEGMLERLQAKIAKFGLANVDLHVMDAQSLEFRSNYFHHVACSFGIFFLPDMLAGLKEWARVTRPGGSVMFTCFGPQAFEPLVGLFRARIARYGAAQDADAVGARRLTDPGQCHALLAAAGLTQPEVHTETFRYHLPSAHDWWAVIWNSGLRRLLDRLTPAQQASLRVEHFAEVEGLRTADGLALGVETHFARGRKP